MEHMLDRANLDDRSELPADLPVQILLVEIAKQIGAVVVGDVQCMYRVKSHRQKNQLRVHESST